jgi:DNA-binding transcriptional LysR family regulator
MPGRIGRLIVAPALPDFVARYPEIELQMGLTDRTVDLVGENIDCALRVGPLGNSELIARPIGILPLINVASPAYLARHGTPQTPDDLKAHLAVRYASPSTGKVELWEWIEDGTLRSTPMQGPITVNSAEAYIACCLAGLGLIQIPAYDVKDHLRSGALVEVMPLHRAEPLPMTLLYPHRRHPSRRVRVFSHWLEPLLKAVIVDPGERTAPKSAPEIPVPILQPRAIGAAATLDIRTAIARFHERNRLYSRRSAARLQAGEPVIRLF